MTDVAGPCIAHKDPKLPPPLALPEGPEWVSHLSALDAGAAETLVAVVRTLYPHDGLPDRVYRRVVAALDGVARAQPVPAQRLAEFLDALKERGLLPFRELSESYRVQALKAIEGSAAFRFVQRASVRFLYDDVEVWRAFGYEGASVHLGGYIERGYNDLAWLPEPPVETGSDPSLRPPELNLHGGGEGSDPVTERGV
jgi:hypothetical protein